MAQILPFPGWQVFDINGNPVGGALAYFYDAITLLAKIVYSDAALTIPHAQPVVADAAGRFPAIYGAAGEYKLDVKTSAGVQVFPTVNNWTILENLTAQILSIPTTIKTANYAVTAADRGKVLEFDASGAPGSNIVVTLNATSLGAGFPVWIANAGISGTTELQFGGGETLLDLSTYQLVDKHQIVGVTSRGAAGWRIIASHGGPFDTLRTFNAGLTSNGPTTLNKAVVTATQTLTDAGTIAWDMALAANAAVTITANRIFGLPTNIVDGQEGGLIVKQNGTGGWKPTWNAIFRWPADLAEHPSPEVSAVTYYRWKARDGIIQIKREWMSGRNSLGFWKEYDKGAYAVSTLYTQAHGLGRYPAQIAVFLENTTTEAGWAVGDRLLVSTGAVVHASSQSAVTVGMDATSVYLSTATALPSINNKTTGAGAAIVAAANWKVIMRIYE